LYRLPHQYNRLDAARRPFERFVLVTDGHRQSEQVFQRLPWIAKLDRNSPGANRDALRQIPKLLAHDPDRSLDEDLRLFDAFSAQLFDDARTLQRRSTSNRFFLARRNFLQPFNHCVRIGRSARPHAAGDAGREDLLGAAAANLKQYFRVARSTNGRRSRSSSRQMSLILLIQYRAGTPARVRHRR
jgi:hypothetical protein